MKNDSIEATTPFATKYAFAKGAPAESLSAPIMALFGMPQDGMLALQRLCYEICCMLKEQ